MRGSLSKVAVIALIGVALTAVAGCGGGGGGTGGGGNVGPTVTAPSTFQQNPPTQVDDIATPLAVDATITSSAGIQSVVMTVTIPGVAIPAVVPMSLKSGNTWEGFISDLGHAGTFHISITATDVNNNFKTLSGLSFHVGPPDVPPT